MSSLVKYLELSKAEKKKISPASPYLPQPLDLPELPTFHDIHTYLHLMRTSLKYSDDEKKIKSPHKEYAVSPWFLICNPIAFVNRSTKRKWQKKNEDYGNFYCFSEFFKEDLSRKICRAKSATRRSTPRVTARIGLFHTKEGSISAGCFPETQTHAWVVIYAKAQDGYELWIFDSNIAEEESFACKEIEFLNLSTPTQATFINLCETKQATPFKRIWINRFYSDWKEGSGTGLQRCMEFLHHFLQSNLWISWPWSPKLSRAYGFKPVVRGLSVSNRFAPGSSENPIIIPDSPKLGPGVHFQLSPQARSRSASPCTRPAIRQRQRLQLRESRVNIKLEPISRHKSNFEKEVIQQEPEAALRDIKLTPRNGPRPRPPSILQRNTIRPTKLFGHVSKSIYRTNTLPAKKSLDPSYRY